MRQKIKEVLDEILKRIGSRDIPPLDQVPTFPFAEDPNSALPDGDLVMVEETQPDWNALAREARFEQ